MKLLLLLFNLAIIAASSCNKEDKSQTETWWVNSARVDCVGAGPMTCYQIQKSDEIESGKWQLFYDEIQGFDYQPGYLYQIKVEILKKSEPIPADASSMTFKLIEVLQKKADQRLALTNIWKILHVGKFNNPTSVQNLGSLTSENRSPFVFQFDGAQSTYFGDTGCNTVRGSFTLSEGNGILFGKGASTMKACPDMEVELEIQKVLPRIRSFEIENGRLYLRDEGGQILMSFQAVD